jgi:hypothetical protein
MYHNSLLLVQLIPTNLLGSRGQAERQNKENKGIGEMDVMC